VSASSPITTSVVIPGYNRAEPLKYTLRSAARAAAAAPGRTEVILVDDGSVPPLAEQLAGFDAGVALTHRRQENQGSIVARLAGLAAAAGTYVLFLDSDDLVAPEKLARQVAAMEAARADVSYADMGAACLGPSYSTAGFAPAEVLPATAEPGVLFLRLQPAPHNPLYRRSYLAAALAEPLVAPERAMDPAGDVWLYYNLAAFPAAITKVAGALSANGPHNEERYSRHWEKLGAAAFRSWRGLPRGFSRELAGRLLDVYRRAPRASVRDLGPPAFAALAALVGPVAAGRLLRVLRPRPYAQSRTLTDPELRLLLADLEASRPRP
jgi:glycosyltransferase involved in cell wall biosynthesis